MARADPGPARLDLLASALAARSLRVLAGPPGAPGWTDGAVVFLDPAADAADRLVTLAVQTALLATGGLAPDVVRALRRPAQVRRYLAVEGRRALTVQRDLLPPAVSPLADREGTPRSGSPAGSLALALGGDDLPDPPVAFGTIRPGRLLAAAVQAADAAGTGEHVPRRRRPRELADREGQPDDGAVLHLPSTPAGTGGPVGRLLARLLLGTARTGGGGPPGADAPTHRGRAGRRSGGRPGARSVVGLPARGETAAVGRPGFRYPEWDVHRGAYRPDWCTVLDDPPTSALSRPLPTTPSLRRPLAALATELERRGRRRDGDDVDIDAVVATRADTSAGAPPADAVFVHSERRRRDLSVLVLLDVSGSAAEPGAEGVSVHEHQRAATAALGRSFQELGDRVAVHAFRSQGRSAVWVTVVKRFDDGFDDAVLRRLHGLEPGGYTRLGAAIRHGGALLERGGGTRRRLLVVLSDGFAYDHGYEPRYGEADARRALAEARARGTACLCLTVGSADADVDALRRVFGASAHAVVPTADGLGRFAGPLFLTALRSAEGRRQVSRSGCDVPVRAALHP